MFDDIQRILFMKLKHFIQYDIPEIRSCQFRFPLMNIHSRKLIIYQKELIPS